MIFSSHELLYLMHRLVSILKDYDYYELTLLFVFFITIETCITY